jgi:hypothetical protein
MAAMTGAVVLLVVGSGLELHRRRVVVLSLAQVVGVTGISPPEHGVLVGGHHADRLAQVGADDRRSVPPGVPRLAAPRPYALGIGVPSMLASLGLALSAAARVLLQRIAPAIQRVGGALLVLLGVLLVTGAYDRLPPTSLASRPAWGL